MTFKLIAILFFKYLHLLDLDGPACTSHYPTTEDKDINMNTHSIFCVFQGVFCCKLHGRSEPPKGQPYLHYCTSVRLLQKSHGK